MFDLVKSKDCTIYVAKNKDADQLGDYRAAYLRLCCFVFAYAKKKKRFSHNKTNTRGPTVL